VRSVNSLVSVYGTRRPYISLLTKMKSPICIVGIIDADGILNASTTNARSISAIASATPIDSAYSKIGDLRAVAASLSSAASITGTSRRIATASSPATAVRSSATCLSSALRSAAASLAPPRSALPPSFTSARASFFTRRSSRSARGAAATSADIRTRPSAR
jgi:hypothetical protein